MGLFHSSSYSPHRPIVQFVAGQKTRLSLHYYLKVNLSKSNNKVLKTIAKEPSTRSATSMLNPDVLLINVRQIHRPLKESEHTMY